jgi:hypothetical protein
MKQLCIKVIIQLQVTTMEQNPTTRNRHENFGTIEITSTKHHISYTSIDLQFLRKEKYKWQLFMFPITLCK